MFFSYFRIARILEVGIHNHGKDHLRPACRRRSLVKPKRRRAFTGNRFAVNGGTIGGAIANQKIHIGIVGIAAVREKAHTHLLGSALHLERDIVRARPARSNVLVRDKVIAVRGHALVRCHFPGVTVVLVVPIILFPVGIATKIIIQQGLDLV